MKNKYLKVLFVLFPLMFLSSVVTYWITNSTNKIFEMLIFSGYIFILWIVLGLIYFIFLLSMR